MLKKFLRVMIWVLLVVVIYVLLDAIPAARTPAFSADVLPDAATYSGTDAENELIFRLTGLGASAVHDFKQAGVLESALEIFYRQKQEALHTKDEYLCFPTTKAEVLHDEEGSRRELVFPAVHAGDILITKSTETLLYRHGHAALVLDDSGRTIESFMIGVPSDILTVDNWRSYSTVMILRPKVSQKEIVQKAAEYAETYLQNIPYNICTGIRKKDKSETGVDSTQCAHLVWQAYYASGLDIDGDGGWLVTPHDVTKCSEFEVVFSFGFGKNSTW